MNLFSKFKTWRANRKERRRVAAALKVTLEKKERSEKFAILKGHLEKIRMQFANMGFYVMPSDDAINYDPKLWEAFCFIYDSGSRQIYEVRVNLKGGHDIRKKAT